MEEKLMVIEVADNVFANEIEEVKIQGNQIKVVDDGSYELAGNFLKDVKANQKKVKDYFAPLKEQAYKTHKAITSRESETLKPLEEMERQIKSEMTKYFMEQERKRREAEELLRKQIEEEKRRAFEEAQKLEQEGNLEESEMALEAAINAEDMMQFAKVEAVKPDVKGISTQKDYEVYITDEAKVPCYIMGACVRDINLQAIKKLIKATDGKIKIDGISFRETVIMKSR